MWRPEQWRHSQDIYHVTLLLASVHYVLSACQTNEAILNGLLNTKLFCHDTCDKTIMEEPIVLLNNLLQTIYKDKAKICTNCDTDSKTFRYNGINFSSLMFNNVYVICIADLDVKYN